MEKLVSYELQTFSGGQWKIDSVFDDRELAVYEASRLTDSRRHSAVRVIEEVFDQRTNNFVDRTVFRSAAIDASNEVAREQRKKNARDVAAARTAPGDVKLTATKTQSARRKNGPAISLILTAGGILLIGIVAMVALRHFMAGN